ncbi:glucose-6-phosphate isomerase, archaeal ii / mannose-6-phosphate isomerase, archaeal [hydrocarbon metagenome]|uniref:Glucose-6-phosphate isomerase, archaeal ii / mannose-6-phosphate isomerase, archaeal n=1 Tax=hydrocarbon metagenome TaxID=938273 RepID=A0A0W8E5C6_9ZZZZ
MQNDLSIEKMMGYLYELPEQFQNSLALKFDFIEQYKRNYRNIVVTGLGGSAIGGDILRNYAAKKASIPVIVNRDYHLPAFVGTETLVFAVSYSGNTEETLEAYQEAVKRGAAVIVLSSGGKISEYAHQDNKAVIQVPTGFVPRAAVAWLFAPVALVLGQMGILPGVEQEIKETAAVLKQMRDSLIPTVDVPVNMARVIAGKTRDNIPVIWGTTGVSEVAAQRWKAQINENAKSPAYYNIFPELNHNEIVGFEVPREILQRQVYIILRDDGDYERIKKRIDISKNIIKDQVKNIIEVHSRGESYLARVFSLIYVGDYASVYLALDYGINPTPVKMIDYLKEQLAQ